MNCRFRLCFAISIKSAKILRRPTVSCDLQWIKSRERKQTKSTIPIGISVAPPRASANASVVNERSPATQEMPFVLNQQQAESKSNKENKQQTS